MNRPILMAAAITVCFCGCGDKTNPATDTADTPSVPATKPDSTTKTASAYFPVYDFLAGEISYVDSLPVGIMKYVTVGKKKDSSFIKLEEFHELAGEFLGPDLADSAFRKKFVESSFFDKSTNNATFFYKAADTSTQIRRVDIITFKGEVYDEVKSVYIEKESASADTSVVKKLYWKPKRNFQIITVNDKKPSNQLVKVVWDNREQ